MGIQGLIPLLENSWRSVNVSEFEGCIVAVDAYCWLHKGVYTCAEKLARGEDCDTYVHYCMRFVSMLLAKKIKPILVFDGQRLPAKADTESKRQKMREQNRKKAAELMRLDKGKEASSLLRRSIDVTHKMALKLIKRCREINVDCIVAPYEADSQLAYLNLSGIAHLVITEDSDLLLFGCKRVLFKLDQNGGCMLIEQEKIHLSLNIRPEQFSLDKFRYMCILSGCDYLPSIPGIGLIKARQFINKSTDPDIYKCLSRLGSFMNVKVPPDYRDQFMNADRMFRYQPIYDPLTHQIKPLNEISDPLDIPVLVSGLTHNQAYQLALGNIDPISLEVMDDWDPETQIVPKSKIVRANHKSIWLKDYQTYNCKSSIYKPTKIDILTSENIIESTPTECLKIDRKLANYVTRTSKIDDPPIVKKHLPVTETDILTTLKEIYAEEIISEENKQKNKRQCKAEKSVLDNDFEKILTPDIDDVVEENESPCVFKQSAKRKYTVINTEKKVISGYFSNQVSNSNENIEKEEEWVNPFKCQKIKIPKYEDTDDSLNFRNVVEENRSQCLEDETATKINSNILDEKTSNTNQKVFSCESYSDKTKTTNEYCDEKKNHIIISHNSQNDSISINNDKKTENENDIDEGFCSQNTKEMNIYNITPKQKKRSCPRTGLSKSKSSQTLLDKFGFKTNGQLKH